MMSLWSWDLSWSAQVVSNLGSQWSVAARSTHTSNDICIIDLEILCYKKFLCKNFWILTKFFDSIKLILCAQVKRSGTRLHTPRKCGAWTACCVCSYHTGIGELLVCERELKNAVGTYCCSNRQFIGYWVEICVFHELPASVGEEAMSCKKLPSYAVKPCLEKCAD